MTFDEELIALVRALSAVQSICTNKRIYHWEVLQSAGFDNFPCIVYNIANDISLDEIERASGMRQAEFQFDLYSVLTTDIRSLKIAIDGLNATYGTLLEWITVADTSESFEAPIDLNEKGMKAAQMTVTVWYRQSTTTTTSAP